MSVRSHLVLVLLVLLVGFGTGLAACGGSSAAPPAPPLVVNSIEDLLHPPAGVVTLRSALAAVPSGGTIRFSPELDGAAIALDQVATDHTVLVGEVMGMRMEPSGPVSYLVGYFERDYGRSALYARKDVAIDASALPNGVTLVWDGDEDARVLAVYGDLILANVTIRGGRSTTEELPVVDPEDQPWTLARGAGVAVWGTARLYDCTLYDNHCVGDFDSSRDRGAFGGGLYANVLHLRDCRVCGNTVLGGGAAGGGVYSVGGANDPAEVSTVLRSTISGNRIRALFTYGAGIYSDGGGIGNRKTLRIENTTIAHNVAEPAPGMPPFLLAMGYWRGGGIYMSNGYLHLHASTVVDNHVYGVPRTDDLEKSNLAGGIAATIGNAHAVEEMVIGHSIVCGNEVHELAPDGSVAASYPHDVFTGSLLYFRSMGYNCFGTLDFSQILVPVGEINWRSLCRRHYPKAGDRDGVALADAVDLVGGATVSDWMLSAGAHVGEPALLSCAPGPQAQDRIPEEAYALTEVFAEVVPQPGATDDFLAIMLGRVESHLALPGFAAAFTADFESFLQNVDTDPDTPGPQPYEDPDGDPVLLLADVHWYGPAVTWPKELVNYPWIEFWHRLDAALLDALPALGPEVLGDQEWLDLFDEGPLAENPDLTFRLDEETAAHPQLAAEDQRRTPRPAGAMGDVGALETP